MEAAGVALAVLPLLLNQLDNYVQGIEAFKLFGAKRYRRELEWYRSNLGTQQAIFEDTLYRLLDGVDEYGDWVDDLMKNPLGDLLQRESLRSSLRQRLGNGFDPFCQTMVELSALLSDLHRKLGWEMGKPVVDLRTDKSMLKSELRKFKDIFSKTIYEGMFDRINTANGLLKTLVEHSEQKSVLQKRRHSKRPLIRQRRTRNIARSLHTAVIRGQCWRCPCRDRHAVHFMLKYPNLEESNESDIHSGDDSRFRMIFSSLDILHQTHQWSLGLEIEAETQILQSNTYSQHCRIAGKSPSAKKVQFSIHPEPPSSTSKTFPQSNDAPPISDLCLTLSNVRRTRGISRRPFGCFPADSHRHNMYHIRNLAADLKMRSLSDLIAKSSDYFNSPTSDRFLLTRKQRLRLAVNFACSVLRFEGSWLKAHWRSKDIIFNTDADIDNPFVQWNLGNEANVNIGNMCKGKSNAAPALIQSEILFPLGLVLVELSLCQNLETLRTAEDEDRVEACADLKTAARHLNLVEQQSGSEYKKVVKTCLFWPGSEEFDLDNEEMQDEMYRLVILPLTENLKIFQGGILQ